MEEMQVVKEEEEKVEEKKKDKNTEIMLGLFKAQFG